MGPGSAEGTLRSPKPSSSDPSADAGAEPIPPGDLGSMDLLCSFGCLSVTGQSARGRRLAGTLQGPSSNPGLGILMNSKRKKKKITQTNVLFNAVFHYCNIFCQISTEWTKHQAQSYQQWTFPFPELDTASEPRNWKQQSAFDIHFESVILSFSTTKSSDWLFTVSSCCTNSIPYKHEALVVHTGQDTEYEPQSPGTELEGFKLPGSGWQVRQCRET